ncbi:MULTISPECIES: ABC transporter permease [Bradyrhizobium]|uniref:ABC transporter permease n=1 Tax=Bradyrhizobium centrosematis TaxID=1300039 RepID=UPI00216A9C66|nr:ABC transporter permease [Bradyrhizobium centrosematis]MCS3765924.1 putative spermidine/putrescine transport system permease protein [Bradyrhizobium centrosematis]MCS3778258.1 putative spermidine/putrescine transport system permease protein [Bradyrhizobium centrosematis]
MGRFEWLSRPVLFGAALAIGGYLLLPSLIIIPMALTKGQMIQFPPEWISIHAFADYFEDEQWITSTLVSLKVALLAMMVACLSGSCAAIALQGRRFRGNAVVVSIILAPIAMPLVVLGLADYLFFVPLQFLAAWVKIGFAHSLLVTPYVFVTVQAVLAGLDPALARSASSLGARPLSMLRHVYWPAIRSGVLAGALFAFAVSFDEVVIALFLQSPEATTLPVRMFTSIQYDLTPRIAAIATLLVALAAIALLARGCVARRSRTTPDN